MTSFDSFSTVIRITRPPITWLNTEDAWMECHELALHQEKIEAFVCTIQSVCLVIFSCVEDISKKTIQTFSTQIVLGLVLCHPFRSDCCSIKQCEWLSVCRFFFFLSSLSVIVQSVAFNFITFRFCHDKSMASRSIYWIFHWEFVAFLWYDAFQ